MGPHGERLAVHVIYFRPKALREKFIDEHPVFVGVILVAWMVLVCVVVWLLVTGP